MYVYKKNVVLFCHLVDQVKVMVQPFSSNEEPRRSCSTHFRLMYIRMVILVKYYTYKLYRVLFYLQEPGSIVRKPANDTSNDVYTVVQKKPKKGSSKVEPAVEEEKKPEGVSKQS